MTSLRNLLPHIYHVQPNPQAYSPDYGRALDELHGNLRKLYSDPTLLHTKQTDELTEQLADQVAHLRLGDDLMQNTSSEWKKTFSERELVTQRQAVLKVTKHLTDPGDQLMMRYKSNMKKGQMACAFANCACIELLKEVPPINDIGVGWTDTDVRAAQAWAINELKGLKQELSPLSEAAQTRTRQYLDSLGITDRYRGYRNNLCYLGKVSRTLDIDPSIKTRSQPSLSPRWHLGREEQLAKIVGTQIPQCPGDTHSSECPFDPVFTAGIDPIYPGKTEYEDRFIFPPLHDIPSGKMRPPAHNRSTREQPPGVRGRGHEMELDSERVASKGYKINPTPDYLSRFALGPIVPINERISESKARYTMPDGKQIRIHPWENH